MDRGRNLPSEEVILETEAGVLEIRGKGLHVRELNVENGNLTVFGFIQSMEYTADPGGKKKGLLSRLLK
jgi:sporulation protein YabP